MDLYNLKRGLPPTQDVVLAALVAVAVTFTLPGGTFAADEGEGGALSTSGSGEGGLVTPCECEEEDDSGSATWTITCQPMPGLAGLLGAMGAGAEGMVESIGDWSWNNGMLVDADLDGASWYEPPDDGGTFNNDGFGLWDTLQKQCTGSWEWHKEFLVGDCDEVENPPNCGPDQFRDDFDCEDCPFGYMEPYPNTPPWPKPQVNGPGGAP